MGDIVQSEYYWNFSGITPTRALLPGLYFGNERGEKRDYILVCFAEALGDDFCDFAGDAKSDERMIVAERFEVLRLHDKTLAFDFGDDAGGAQIGVHEGLLAEKNVHFIGKHDDGVRLVLEGFLLDAYAPPVEDIHIAALLALGNDGGVRRVFLHGHDAEQMLQGFFIVLEVLEYLYLFKAFNSFVSLDHAGVLASAIFAFVSITLSVDVP
jgi:hypothetical protein